MWAQSEDAHERFPHLGKKLINATTHSRFITVSSGEITCISNFRLDCLHNNNYYWNMPVQLTPMNNGEAHTIVGTCDRLLSRHSWKDWGVVQIIIDSRANNSASLDNCMLVKPSKEASLHSPLAISCTWYLGVMIYSKTPWNHFWNLHSSALGDTKFPFFVVLFLFTLGTWPFLLVMAPMLSGLQHITDLVISS